MDTNTIVKPRSSGNLRSMIQTFFTRFGVQQLIMLALIASVSLGTVGCKAKKEARARQEALEAKVAEAKAALLAIINDKTRSIEENEQELERVQAMNLQDPEILDLIDRAIAAIEEQKAAEREKLALERTGAPDEDEDAYARISSLFQEVARSSSSDAANAKIRAALSLFASPEAPVLIIINQSGGTTDYDEPTTIRKYLDYLKDTKSNPAEVNNLEYDNSGKIKLVELIKRY